MTLKEISAEYRACAVQLRGELRRLRQEYRMSRDPGERSSLAYRISSLARVLNQINELAELTEHYYDRGYYRDKKYTF